jgi:hypothetical protein
MDIKIKKLLAYVGCLWIGILSQAAAVTMEDILKAINCKFPQLEDGEISYGKLKFLGIDKRAEGILQIWNDMAKWRDGFEGEGVACEYAEEEIFKLYKCKRSRVLVAASIKMEEVLKVCGPYSITCLADVGITCEKLKSLGIAEKAGDILQKWGVSVVGKLALVSSEAWSV